MITNEGRQAFVSELLYEVRNLVFASGMAQQLPEAQERFLYLSEQGELALPTEPEDPDKALEIVGPLVPEAFRFIPAPNRPRGFALYPLVPADVQYGTAFAYYVECVEFANYGPQANLVAMNMAADESPRFLAFCLLHEIGHAMAAEREGRVFQKGSRPTDVRLQEELRMWTFDALLAEILGGETYVRAVNDFVEDIRRFGGQRALCPPSLIEGRGVVLDISFGPAPSDAARRKRDRTFSVYALLSFADYSLCPADALRYKLDVIADAHRGSFERSERLLKKYGG